MSHYAIEDIISKNDSKIEKHSAKCNTLGLEFIILSRYITFKSTITITFVPLKDASNKNSLAISFK